MVIPPTRLKTKGERAFCSVAIRLWNSLPLDLRLEDYLVLFKAQLKTYFLKLLFLIVEIFLVVCIPCLLILVTVYVIFCVVKHLVILFLKSRSINNILLTYLPVYSASLK